MGSLTASHLVTALVNAAVEAAVGYSAAGEPAPPSAPAVESQDLRQTAIAHLHRQEWPQAAPRPPHSVSLSNLVPLYGLSLDRAQISDLARDSRAAENPAASVPTVPVMRSLIGNAIHIEMPRIEPNGRFVRPKIVFGLASPEMKSWLRSQGIGAEKCMFPMLRARARLNQESREVSAGVTLYARCTFY